MNKENKLFLDTIIENWKSNNDFKEIIDYICDKMRGDESIKGELAFYESVSKDILKNPQVLSYDEKEHFIAIHKACLDVYTFS